MSRRRRRIWIVLAIVLLVLLGTGGWLFHTLVWSPEQAMRQAEAFLLRRLTVAQVAGPNRYRFFYATNRRADGDAVDLTARFGSERHAGLSFGHFDTTIEPTLGVGAIINPAEWFQNEEIRLHAVTGLNRAAFTAQLRQLVEASPSRALLVVLHGFREAFPSALRKTAYLGHVLDINAPTLLFDWPGNQGSSLRGYRRANAVAKASGAELAALLQLIIGEIRPERLWLVANSMGAQVVADAFTLLYQDPALADPQAEFEDVVLTAPDVSHEDFDRQFKREIAALTRHLTVYVSSNDRALLMSRIINRERRRGESTLSPQQLEEAYKIADMVDPDSELVTLVDVTAVNRTRNFHNFSLESPEYFDDLFARLTNPATPRSRRLYRIRTPEGADYWVLTRGR